MKKFFLTLATLLIAMASAFAQKNEGQDQLSVISPVPGDYDLSWHESGLNGMLFSFKDGKGEVNRSADLFITVKRNGNVICNVPASNTSQIKYDNFMDFVWQVVFFPNSSYECFAGGEYEVTIPEGFFLIGEDNTPNQKIVLSYNMLLGDKSIVIFPAESKTMAELKEFTITFGDAVSIDVNPEASHMPELVNLFGGSDDEEGEAETYDFNITINGNTATLTLKQSILQGSTYNLCIPEGCFVLTNENGVTSPNKELVYQYGIPKVGLGQPAIYPDYDVLLDFPGVIELTLNPGEKLVLPNEMGKNGLYCVNEDGTLGDIIADYRAAAKNSHFYKDSSGKVIESNANKVFLVNVLGEDVHICPAPGRYQLITSKMLYNVTIDGKMISVDSFTYNFEVIDGNLFDMEFTPEAGSTTHDLKEIKVKFPYAEEIQIEWAPAKFASATTNYVFYPNGNVEDNTVTFSTGVPVTLDGYYRFISNLKSVCVDGDYVGIMVDYEISQATGVDRVCEPIILPEHFDIYNAQGMMIKKGATTEELNALPAGIYIAGGKKIVNR